jgi:hypothetical protein
MPRDSMNTSMRTRVLMTLSPGEYEYKKTIVGHDFMAYEIRRGDTTGYVIHYSGGIEACAK